MKIKRKWLFGSVLLCAVGGAVLLFVFPRFDSPPEPRTFVQIPSYAYATERRGGQMSAFLLSDFLGKDVHGLPADAVASTQVVMLEMESELEAISIFGRISLEYPLEWLPLEERIGSYARRLGDSHAVFVHNRLVVHISVLAEFENRSDFLNAVTGLVFDKLGPPSPVDWLVRVSPNTISGYRALNSGRIRRSERGIPPISWSRSPDCAMLSP